ncbi:MAG TPA: response regulator [Burkholderiaceae bacterium]|nr:response regulator [Burkholderiaceae bacterium]
MSDSVLIVDDSLTVRMDLADAFESAGFRPIACETLAKAREVLAGTPVDVVVLDMLLPDGDGADLLKEIRATPATSTVPVLILSTEAEVKDRIRGLQTGADEYVGKPYEAAYLVARARQFLRARHAQANGNRPAILIIDDSVTFRESLGQSLEDAGYTALRAASGEQGLQLAAAHRVDAIIVDGELPGIDGATVIRHIRLDAALRGIPCLLLTASQDRGAELRALDAGADAFLHKDEDADLILAKLAATLRGTAATAANDRTPSLLAPRKILAVDDSPTYLQELGAALREEGYDVVLARSGEEALELLAVQPVDCILLDLLMPGLDGQETCRRIKAAPVVRDIPLIMLTAVEDRTAMLDGLSAGADDYISKSGEFTVLKARVRAQLRRKQSEDENRSIREQLLRKELEATEARAAQLQAQARAVLMDELERKNQELEAFGYSVSHDLRTPLRAIAGFSQMLLEDYAGQLDDRGQEYLGRVRDSAHRMGELISDLLKLSRIGRAEMVKQTVDISNIARRVATDLQQREPERSVELQIEDGLTDAADGRLMTIVLENLLGNAWKFSAKVPHPCIAFGAHDSAQGRAYFVRDNGAGFDMTYAEKLFRPFQRLHSEAEFPGTGIGLATVQRIIDRHGGRVWAESGAGEGATFFFTLGR